MELELPELVVDTVIADGGGGDVGVEILRQSQMLLQLREKELRTLSARYLNIIAPYGGSSMVIGHAG